jgi:hypothetical protein
MGADKVRPVWRGCELRRTVTKANIVLISETKSSKPRVIDGGGLMFLLQLSTGLL